MTDLLIKLYDLPEKTGHFERVAKQDITVRRARAYEKSPIADWVRTQFGRGWADECRIAFSRQPISCFLATIRGGIAGFACYECTCRGFFGPIGVSDSFRGQGIGSALLFRSLHAMAEAGYAYAVVGNGDAAIRFYSSAVQVQPITGSTPGIYADPLNLPDVEKT
jgi:ribosomal protein S18 acetylase RimI-like enzyme